MNALRLDPSERIFTPFNEPRSGPRFSRRTLIAIGITSVVYGGLGFYFMNQKYEMAPFHSPIEDDPILVESRRLTPPPPPKPEEKPVLAPRQVDTPLRTTVPPLPLTPTETTPAENIMPVSAEPAPPTPLAELSSPAGTGTAPPAPPSVIRNPVWISRPTPEQMGQLYPQRAAERDRTGSATLLCGIRANGTMTDCQVIAETPVGWQFGKAALQLAQYFRISPQTIDGAPVEGSKVRIPVVFSLGN